MKRIVNQAVAAIAIVIGLTSLAAAQVVQGTGVGSTLETSSHKRAK